MTESTKLYAGAAKVCITPSPDYFPMEHLDNRSTPGRPSMFSGAIREDIFLRVLVVENRQRRLVFAVLDLPGVPEANILRKEISQCAQVSEENVLLTATHNHSGLYVDNDVFMRKYGEAFAQKVRRYRGFIRQVIPQAVSEALAQREPVRLGIGKGESFLNVNRNQAEVNSLAGTYGFSPERPADRDLFLIRLDREDGTPLALLYNYAVHACMMIHNNPDGKGTEISGDLPGRVCRILEQEWKERTIVIFTSGCAGDMNPLMMARVNLIQEDGSVITRDLGAAGPTILDFMGNRLVQDVRRVNEQIECRAGCARLWAGIQEFSLTSQGLIRADGGKDTHFRMGLMLMGNLALVATNGEIFHRIGQRLKAASPYRNTVLVTHAGPWTGYIKDDSGKGEYEHAARHAMLNLMERCQEE